MFDNQRNVEKSQKKIVFSEESGSGKTYDTSGWIIAEIHILNTNEITTYDILQHDLEDRDYFADDGSISARDRNKL